MDTTILHSYRVNQIESCILGAYSLAGELKHLHKWTEHTGDWSKSCNKHRDKAPCVFRRGIEMKIDPFCPKVPPQDQSLRPLAVAT